MTKTFTLSIVLFSTGLGGCALGPGRPFAELQAQLEVSVTAPADRALADGWQRTSTGFDVKWTAVQLTLEDLALQERSAGGGVSFDPAHPPPGYTVCHNGHCDREDGAHVSYEEVTAEMAGGTGGLQTVVHLGPIGEVDALAGVTTALGCEPSCALGLASISRAAMEVAALQLEGVVRDGTSPARMPERTWQLVVAPEESPVLLHGELDLPADNESGYSVQLHASLVLTSTLIDDLPWLTLDAQGSHFDFTTPANAAARAEILEHLAQTELALTVLRK